MNFKKILFFITAIIFITLIAFHFRQTKVFVAGQPVWVKIAKTPSERQQGLSGVRKLADDEGMLFVFPEKQQPTFWMKDMNFPLDFIWISDKKIVDLTENVLNPSPDTPEPEISRCQPKQPVDMVLEVNAGWIAKNKIKIGDPVQAPK